MNGEVSIEGLWPHGTRRQAEMARFVAPFASEVGSFSIRDSRRELAVEVDDSFDFRCIIVDALNEYYANRQPGRVNSRGIGSDEVDAILLASGTTGKQQVWFTRKEAVSAIIAASNFN